MLKYTEAVVTFSEVPNEVTLCVNISNCPYKCKGCHSPYLRRNVGTVLDIKELDRLIKANEGITCVSFMGGSNDLGALSNLIYHVHNNTGLKVCWYTGDTGVPPSFFKWLDYVKVGPYIEEKGGLDSPNTNQRFYKICDGKIEDITHDFWNKENK